MALDELGDPLAEKAVDPYHHLVTGLHDAADGSFHPQHARAGKRDAQLVYAGMRGVIVQLAIQVGWKPGDLNAHGEWLRSRSASYIRRVTEEVLRLEVAAKEHADA